MLTNSDMHEGRFLRLHKARLVFNRINGALSAGLRIQVTTYTQSRIYSAQSQFKMAGTSVYAQRGKHWDDITFCHIRAVR